MSETIKFFSPDFVPYINVLKSRKINNQVSSLRKIIEDAENKYKCKIGVHVLAEEKMSITFTVIQSYKGEVLAMRRGLDRQSAEKALRAITSFYEDILSSKKEKIRIRDIADIDAFWYCSMRCSNYIMGKDSDLQEIFEKMSHDILRRAVDIASSNISFVSKEYNDCILLLRKLNNDIKDAEDKAGVPFEMDISFKYDEFCFDLVFLVQGRCISISPLSPAEIEPIVKKIIGIFLDNDNVLIECHSIYVNQEHAKKECRYYTVNPYWLNKYRCYNELWNISANIGSNAYRSYDKIEDWQKIYEYALRDPYSYISFPFDESLDKCVKRVHDKRRAENN